VAPEPADDLESLVKVAFLFLQPGEIEEVQVLTSPKQLLAKWATLLASDYWKDLLSAARSQQYQTVIKLLVAVMPVYL
jgi:hypothetical protein